MIKSVTLTIDGDPVAKPRQTKSDKWRKRRCVMRYREWADKARTELGKWNIESGFSPLEITATAFFSIPKYLIKKISPYNFHRKKPDADNVIKAINDALFPRDDSMIASVHFAKRYSNKPMVIIEINYSNE